MRSNINFFYAKCGFQILYVLPLVSKILSCLMLYVCVVLFIIFFNFMLLTFEALLVVYLCERSPKTFNFNRYFLNKSILEC